MSNAATLGCVFRVVVCVCGVRCGVWVCKWGGGVCVCGVWCRVGVCMWCVVGCAGVYVWGGGVCMWCIPDFTLTLTLAITGAPSITITLTPDIAIELTVPVDKCPAHAFFEKLGQEHM
jgi:hypothetical protein